MGPLAGDPWRTVLVRDLDDEVLKRLKAAAKAARRPLEAEIREILTAASMRSSTETRRLSARWLKRLAGQRMPTAQLCFVKPRGSAPAWRDHVGE